MNKHSAIRTPRTTEHATCYACGQARPIAALRPFGHRADGTAASHVCDTCASPVAAVAPRPPRNWYPHHALVGAAK